MSMALQRVTLRATELRCVAQAEGSGGSEPYVWLTFFAVGAAARPGQTGPVAAVTQAYNSFRDDIPNHVKAGQAIALPPFASTASFDMDLDVSTPKLVGCIAVLMEEDDTPASSIELGYIAYAKAIDQQLNEFVSKRIARLDFGPITDAEIAAIKNAVNAKVEAAIGSNQSWWNLFTDQDDNIGFTYKTFSDAEIHFQYFDFPEMVSGGNRFVLSGGVSLGRVPGETVDLCATPRAALKAKQDEIKGLQLQRTALQHQLQHATPQQKAAIVASIQALGEQIAQAEAQLPALQDALDACTSHHHHIPPVNDGSVVVG
jgi:hypothetical protein